MPEECHLVVRGAAITGRVTSAVRSPALEKTVGLAYVGLDQSELGSVFDIKVAGGRLIQGRVVPIPFYDPENKWRSLAAKPSMTDVEYLKAALTLCRLEWSFASGPHKTASRWPRCSSSWQSSEGCFSG